MHAERKAFILLTLNLLVLAAPLLAPSTTKLAIGWFIARGNYGAAFSVAAAYCFMLAKILMPTTVITGPVGIAIAVGSLFAG